MPHLPFSSNMASYTVTDDRGAYATHDSDGRICMPASREWNAPVSRSPTLVKRRATAVHGVDHTIPFNDSHRPALTRSPSAQTILRKPGTPARPATWDASAFCGTTGHLPNSVRVSHMRSARPALASVLSGEAFLVFTDGPTYATPAAVDYDPQCHLASTRRAPHPRWRPMADTPGQRTPKFNGDARAPDQWHDGRSGALVHTSKQLRLVDTTPIGDATIADATPGPGSYPGAEYSDFAPRPRSVRSGSPSGLYQKAQSTFLDGFGREHASVRAATSCFGSGARSDIRETLVDVRGRGRGWIQTMADYTRTPGGATYSALPNDTRVYLTYKGKQQGLSASPGHAAGSRGTPTGSTYSASPGAPRGRPHGCAPHRASHRGPSADDLGVPFMTSDCYLIATEECFPPIASLARSERFTKEAGLHGSQRICMSEVFKY